MKTILICLAIFISSCSHYPSDGSIQLAQEIIKTDLAMSDLAIKEGFLISLYKYADEDFVKFNEGNHPVIGKKAYKELYKDKPGPKTLTWKPLKAEVAESGELGYTWGNWKFVLPDTIVYGNYFTLWKKHSDGNWKMLLDGGNGAPPPEE